MLISILTNRINQSLSYAESLNLTNTEEQKLTIQLVKDLIKLLNLILTKEEKKLYKKKVSLVKSSHRLKKLNNVFESKSQTIIHS